MRLASYRVFKYYKTYFNVLNVLSAGNGGASLKHCGPPSSSGQQQQAQGMLHQQMFPQDFASGMNPNNSSQSHYQALVVCVIKLY